VFGMCKFECFESGAFVIDTNGCTNGVVRCYYGSGARGVGIGGRAFVDGLRRVFGQVGAPECGDGCGGLADRRAVEFGGTGAVYGSGSCGVGEVSVPVCGAGPVGVGVGDPVGASDAAALLGRLVVPDAGSGGAEAVLRGPNGGESFGRGPKYLRNLAKRVRRRRKVGRNGFAQEVTPDGVLKSRASCATVFSGLDDCRFSSEVQAAKQAAIICEYQLREAKAARAIRQVGLPGGGGYASTVLSGCSSSSSVPGSSPSYSSSSGLSSVSPGSSVSQASSGEGVMVGYEVLEGRINELFAAMDSISGLLCSLSVERGKAQGPGPLSSSGSPGGCLSGQYEGCNDVCFDDEY